MLGTSYCSESQGSGCICNHLDRLCSLTELETMQQAVHVGPTTSITRPPPQFAPAGSPTAQKSRTPDGTRRAHRRFLRRPAGAISGEHQCLRLTNVTHELPSAKRG